MVKIVVDALIVGDYDYEDCYWWYWYLLMLIVKMWRSVLYISATIIDQWIEDRLLMIDIHGYWSQKVLLTSYRNMDKQLPIPYNQQCRNKIHQQLPSGKPTWQGTIHHLQPVSQGFLWFIHCHVRLPRTNRPPSSSIFERLTCSCCHHWPTIMARAVQSLWDPDDIGFATTAPWVGRGKEASGEGHIIYND